MKNKAFSLIKLVIVVFTLGALVMIVIHITRMAEEGRQVRLATAKVTATLEGKTKDGYLYVATLKAIGVSKEGYSHQITFKTKETDEKTGEQATILALDFRKPGEKTCDGTPDIYTYKNIPIGHPFDLSRKEIQVDYETLMTMADAKQATEAIANPDTTTKTSNNVIITPPPSEIPTGIAQ